jgi:hypothetical protein
MACIAQVPPVFGTCRKMNREVPQDTRKV